MLKNFYLMKVLVCFFPLFLFAQQNDQIGVVIHIIGNDDGSGYIAESTAREAVQSASNNFNVINVDFIVIEVLYIDDSNYALISESEIDLLLGDHNRYSGKAINVYFSPAIDNANGVATLPSPRDAMVGKEFENEGIIIENAYALTTTTTHEFGHFFGLLHTHEAAIALEYPQSYYESNSTIAGDLIADTPAEPDPKGNTNWDNDNNCSYQGKTHFDKDGNTYPYMPWVEENRTNFMTTKSECRSTFTGGQKSYMDFQLRDNDGDRKGLIGNIWLKLTNKIDNQDAGGSLMASTKTVKSGDFFLYTAPIDIKTQHEWLQGVNKHHDWNGENGLYKLSRTNFTATVTTPDQDANFDNTSVANFASTNSFDYELHDPWWVNNGSQPDDFFPLSEVAPSNAHSVFLDQNPQFQAGLPVYSVRADEMQQTTEHGETVDWYFQYWTGNDVDFESSTSLETAVVFQDAGAEARAIYKGHLASNEARATGFNNSRQMAREGGTRWGEDHSRIHIVYEDNDEIWYTYSTDDGESWQPEIRLSEQSTGDVIRKHANPCIDLSEDHTSKSLDYIAHVVWETEVIYGSVVEKAITARSMDYETGQWEQEVSIYPASMGLGDPVSASHPIVFVGGGTAASGSGEWSSVHVAFRRDSDEQIMFTRKVKMEYWDDYQEVPGAFGLPVSSQIVSTTHLLYLVWADDGEIKHAKATWNDGSNSYSWSSVNNLTGHLPYYLINHRVPSIAYDGSYAHLTWIGEHLHLIADEIYYQKYDFRTNPPTPVGNLTALQSNEVYPIGDPVVSIYGSFEDVSEVDVFYQRGSNIYRKKKSGSSWSTKNFSSGKYPTTPDRGVSCAVWTKYSSAPYIIKSDFETQQLYKVISADSLSEKPLTVNQRFDYLFPVSESEKEFMSLVLSSTTVNEIPVEFDDDNTGSTLRFSGSDDVEMNWTVFRKNSTTTLGAETPVMDIYLVEGEKRTVLERYIMADFQTDSNNEEEAMTTSFLYSALDDANGYLEIVFPETQPHITNLLAETDEAESLAKGIFSSVDNRHIPAQYELSQNYPNPFNPVTHIRFGLPQRSDAKLSVYNMKGQVVAELVNGIYDAGRYEVVFNAGGLASGVYIYHLQAGSFRKSGRMLLIK